MRPQAERSLERLAYHHERETPRGSHAQTGSQRLAAARAVPLTEVPVVVVHCHAHVDVDGISDAFEVLVRFAEEDGSEFAELVTTLWSIDGYAT